MMMMMKELAPEANNYKL